MAGRRTFRVLTSSKKKQQRTHSTTNTHKITTTIHTTNQQQLLFKKLRILEARLAFLHTCDYQYYHTLECDAVSSSTVKMTAKTGDNFLPD